MQEITVANIKIRCSEERIKNLHLAVYPPTGRVRIAAPVQTNDEAIRLFAVSKLGWIKRHQRTFEVRTEKQQENLFREKVITSTAKDIC